MLIQDSQIHWMEKVDWLRCIHEATVATFGPANALFMPDVIADPARRSVISLAIMSMLRTSSDASEVYALLGIQPGSNRALYLEFVLRFIRTSMLPNLHQQVFLVSYEIEAALTFLASDLEEMGGELSSIFMRLKEEVAPAFSSTPENSEEWRMFATDTSKGMRMTRLLATLRAEAAEPSNQFLRELLEFNPLSSL